MNRIGVVGAGTMGAGIAQVAAQAGLAVRLYDVGAAPLAAGMGRIQSVLDQLVARGKMAGTERDAVLARIQTTESLSDFADVELVIEAAPEVLDLKHRIFTELDSICPAATILATNTSSLSVTEIAAVTQRPARVVGMHFFNPVPAMRLVEVISSPLTAPAAADVVHALAEQLGKTPVRAKDTPAFIVNRVARSFSGEALRIYGEGGATVPQIDRIARMAGGFRMGPFELMDLVGMDVNYAVNRSVFDQFFQEPRYRPHPLQAQMVKANRLGRKTGAGWYRYEGDQAVGGPAGPEFYGKPGARVGTDCTVWVGGDAALSRLVREAGYRVVDVCGVADIVLFGSPAEAAAHRCRDRSLILVGADGDAPYAVPEHLRRGRVVRFAGLPDLAAPQLVEVGSWPGTDAAAVSEASAFFRSLGRDVEVVRDRPGFVAPRLIACLVNEAAYALMEGVASAADIDTAMRLGVNYPHGPLEWADAIGPERVLRILEGLHRYFGDDRYRPCPLLRELVAAGQTFRGTAG